MAMQTNSAFSADYQVNQPCEQEGVLARAIAKDASAFSGTPIALVCLDRHFAFARGSKFDADKCLHVIARRDGKDTDVAVKSLDGKPICSE